MKSLQSIQIPAGLGREITARSDIGVKDRLSGFIALVRPVFFVLTPINAAAAVVLALGSFPPLSKCILGFLAVALASCAVNAFNDYADRERDKALWPDRPIPGNRVRPNEALLVAAVSMAISLPITWFAFNPTTFYILLLALVLGSLYSIYLRDKVGYLSLPPIVGLIYLGGWVAFSPGTLFGNWLPWYLYLLGVVWQTAHIMIYYPLHIVSGMKNPPALFFRPSPRFAVRIGIIFTCLTLALSSLLPLVAPGLGVIYLVLVITTGIYALIYGLRLYKSIMDRQRGMAAFMSLSVFRLVISAAILLSIFMV